MAAAREDKRRHMLRLRMTCPSYPEDERGFFVKAESGKRKAESGKRKAESGKLRKEVRGQDP